MQMNTSDFTARVSATAMPTMSWHLGEPADRGLVAGVVADARLREHARCPSSRRRRGTRGPTGSARRRTRRPRRAPRSARRADGPRAICVPSSNGSRQMNFRPLVAQPECRTPARSAPRPRGCRAADRPGARRRSGRGSRASWRRARSGRPWFPRPRRDGRTGRPAGASPWSGRSAD